MKTASSKLARNQKLLQTLLPVLACGLFYLIGPVLSLYSDALIQYSFSNKKNWRYSLDSFFFSFNKVNITAETIFVFHTNIKKPNSHSCQTLLPPPQLMPLGTIRN